MDQENRRSFVRKSLATSMTFTFSGLIRAAHGATTIPYGSTNPSTEDTTIDPWSDNSGGITIDLSEISDFTLATDFTIDQWSAWSIDPVTDPEYTLPDCDKRNPPVQHDWAAPMPLSQPFYEPNLGITYNFIKHCKNCSAWQYLSL